MNVKFCVAALFICVSAVAAYYPPYKTYRKYDMRDGGKPYRKSQDASARNGNGQDKERLSNEIAVLHELRNMIDNLVDRDMTTTTTEETTTTTEPTTTETTTTETTTTETTTTETTTVDTTTTEPPTTEPPTTGPPTFYRSVLLRLLEKLQQRRTRNRH